MNIFYAITSRKSITTLILLIFNISYSQQSCVPLLDSCRDDCDCCGNADDKVIRCELRNQGLGKRCYASQILGKECDNDSQCNSQNCVNNICQPLLRSLPQTPIQFCPLVSDSSNIVAPVNGLLPTCACPNEPGEDVNYALDSNLSTDYVNYHSQSYSGFIFETSLSAPLKKIELCTSSANEENDPMCFRLEGKCEHEGNFIPLQEGRIPFGSLRQSCTTIKINGRQSYPQYKILFGCRRGGYDDSCQESSRLLGFRGQIKARRLEAECTGDYPIMLSEVKLLGKCNQGLQNPTIPPASSPTSSPTSPPTQAPTQAPNSLFSLGETVLTKGNKVGTIHQPPTNFRLSFQIFPKDRNLFVGNILRITSTNGNYHAYGDRWLAFYFVRSIDVFQFVAGSTRNTNAYLDVKNNGIQESKWNDIRVEANSNDIKLFINDVHKATLSNKNRPPVNKLDVYITEAHWYDAANAIIRDFEFDAL